MRKYKLCSDFSTILVFSVLFIFIALSTSAQSRIPKETTNWIGVTGFTENGDRDNICVIFYEVSDTLTAPIYFFVNNPGQGAGTMGAPNTNSSTTIFYLIGGTGTISASESRLVSYNSTQLTNGDYKKGTILSTFTKTNESEDWVSFPDSVFPGQGEHIGNKYYFKIVAEAASGVGFKNAFQLNCSYTSAAPPAGIGQVRAFVYGLSPIFQDVNQWNYYPFVADTDTGNIVYWNWDFDDEETFYAYDKNNNALAAPARSGNGAAASASYPVAGQTNGTWRLHVVESAGITPQNLAELWFTNSVTGEPLRIYADSYYPPPPHHVAVAYIDGVADSGDGTLANELETVTLQIVGADGSPLEYSRELWITLDKATASIYSTSDSSPVPALPAQNVRITTNTDGFAYVTIRDSVNEMVTLTVITDGITNGCSYLPGTNQSVSVIFQAATDVLPTMTSNALSFVEGNASSLNTITITEGVDANINLTAVNDIYIRIPTGLDAEFDESIVNPAIGGTAASSVTLPVTYLSSNKMIRINLNADLTSNATIIISNLAVKANNSASNGKLELSYNGPNGPFNILNNNSITITGYTTYTWTRNGGTNNWNDAINWLPAVVPNSATANVYIPYVATGMPVVNVANVAVYNLTIAPSATLSMNGNSLTVNGNFQNDGTFILTGTEATLNFVHGMDTNSGTVEYNDTAGNTGLRAGNNYYNLSFINSGTWSLSGNTTVNGDLSVATNAKLNLNSFSLTVTGSFDNQGIIYRTGGAGESAPTDTNSGLVVYQGAGGTIQNPGSYYNLTIDGSGTFSLGTNVSVANALAITNGILNLNNATLTPSMNLDLNSAGGSLRISGAGASLALGTHALTLSAGTLDLDAGSVVAANLTIDGGTFDGTTGGVCNTTLTGSLSLSNGNLSLGNKTITCVGFSQTGGTFTGGTGTLISSSNVAVTGGMHTYNTYTLRMTGNVTTISFSPGLSPYTVEIAALAGNTVSLASHLTIAGNLNIITGTLDVTATPYQLTVAGNWNDTGTFNARTGLVMFNGTGSAGAETFYNVQLGGGIRTVTGDWVITNGLTLSSGTFAPGNNVHHVAGNWNDTALSFQATSGTINLTSPNPIVNQGAANHFSNLTLTDGASLNTNINIDGNLTISGTLNSNNQTINVGGNWDNTGTFTEGIGTVIFDGTGTILHAETFYNFEKNGAGTTTALTATITVSNSLTIISGTLSAGSNTINLSGTSWNNQGGVLNAGTGLVNIQNTGTTSFSGSTTFYDLTCTQAGANLIFQAGSTQSFTHLVTITGTNANHIILSSSASPAKWSIAVTGIADIQCVTVTDSNATVNITPYDSTDGGNNINWLFMIPVQSSYTIDSDRNGKIDRIESRVFAGANLTDNFTGITVSVYGYTVSGFSTGTIAGDHIFLIYLQEGPLLDTGATPTWRITANTTLRNGIGGAFVATNVDNVPEDKAPPILGYTLALPGRNQVYMKFSEAMEEAPGGGNLQATDFGITGGHSITGITAINSSEYLLSLYSPVTASDLLTAPTPTQITIGSSVLQDTAPDPNILIDPPTNSIVLTSHRISDLLLSTSAEPMYTPILAYDQTQRDPDRGGIGYVTVFDGTTFLRPQNIELQARAGDTIPSATGLDATLIYDANVPAQFKTNGLWLEDFIETNYSGLVPRANTALNGETTYNKLQSAVNAQTRNYSFLATDTFIKDGADLEFIFKITNTNAVLTIPLYAVNLTNENAADWYRQLSPWKLKIRNVIFQQAQVSILNNVINSERGEKTNLHYILPTGGVVTITVFDVKGDIVHILKKEIQSAGDYTTSWDGKNRSGRNVARGVYFIRVVAPGIDETLKVLVVK